MKTPTARPPPTVNRNDPSKPSRAEYMRQYRLAKRNGHARGSGLSIEQAAQIAPAPQTISTSIPVVRTPTELMIVDDVVSPPQHNAPTKGNTQAAVVSREGKSPARTQGKLDYFDILCIDPVPRDVFDRCVLRLACGDEWREIAKSEGYKPRELWQMCGKYAHDNPDESEKWKAAQHAELDLNRRDTTIIHAHALSAGLDGLKIKTKRKEFVDDDGNKLCEVETVEERGTDVSLLRLALETGDPEVHGKQAGRDGGGGSGPQVAIQIVVGGGSFAGARVSPAIESPRSVFESPE